MIALQRAVGNTSTVALLRRAGKITEEPPIMFTLPGVVDHAAVDSWSMGTNRGEPTSVEILRPIDENSPRLMEANKRGWPDDATATLVVRRLTPLGWVRQLTLTMEHCLVASYQIGEHEESVQLSFAGMQVEQ